jgi:hypothetical protein
VLFFAYFVSGMVDDVRTYFASPKLYAKAGWQTTNDRFFIPSLSLAEAKIN